MDDQIKEDKIGKACSTKWIDEKDKIVVGKRVGKETTWETQV